ncbi:MAG: class I SAM-dependent methyltransferase [Planctomycetota bacterium]
MAVPFPGDAALWVRFVSGDFDTLIARAAETDPGDVAQVASLRRRASADQVAVAIQIADARRRLAAKTPDARRWISDTAGAQMASDAAVAAHKAKRFAAAADHVADLCCGIGADSAALNAAGVDVDAVDLDERRCIMTRYNAGVEALVHNAESFDATGRVVHMDPARRDGARRLMRPADLVPGPETISRIVNASAGAGVKLMPGINPEDLAPLDMRGGEMEYISRRGRMSQAVWWSGALAQHARSATMLGDSGQGLTIAGEASELEIPPESQDARKLGAWLYQPDPAPERAGLLGTLAEELCLGVLHPSLGLLTGDAHLESPWVTAFAVVERMPWRPKRVREALASFGAGLVEVKTRGGAVDPDRMQGELRCSGDRTLTVFVLRFGTKIEAIIAERRK